MASAFRVADRVALLYHRKIEFVGTKEEAKQGIVQKFVDGQLEE